MLQFENTAGKLLLGNERMLLFRQEAFAALRKLIFDQMGEQGAYSLLAQFGFLCGSGDFANLNQTYEFDSEMDRMAAGPVMHTWEGIVLAQPTFLEFDRGTGHFHMKGTWTNSYEAEIHLKQFGPSPTPVCHTLTGYASGWCSAFFGRKLLAIEPKCIARGDKICEFEIRPPDRWGAEADPWRKSLQGGDLLVSRRELEDKIRLIEDQRSIITQLSTPILEVWDGILCLPVVGMVDAARASAMTDKLLDGVVRKQARGVIVDLTGIDVIDTKTVDHLIKMAKEIKLLGAIPVITGISPGIAQTLTQIGVDLTGIQTLRSLQDGLRVFLRFSSTVDKTHAGNPKA